MKINEIKKIIPSDFSMHTSRDLGLFTASVFGETYIQSFKELFNIEFSIVFWVVRNKNILTFYRSDKEH